jgi:PP-loop superfamily ATP-utilizing enzyme
LLKQGVFNFKEQPLLAYREMTGLRMPANELAMIGLMRLKDWSGLSRKLPAPEVALQRLSDETKLKLEYRCQQVWQLSHGNLSLIEIAKSSNLQIEKVQQIAFCLITLGLVYVVFPEGSTSIAPIDRDRESLKNISDSAKPATISTSFLGNLMSFLKKKS